MKSIDEIGKKLHTGQFEFTRHAFRRAIERNISAAGIMECGKRTRIVEKYLDDKYAPSCLLLGFTDEERPLHIQISLADTDLVKIITIYEPEEDEWIDYLTRR
jgi:hypothetical protein